MLPVAVLVGWFLLAHSIQGGSAVHDRLVRLAMSAGGGAVVYGLTIYWRGGRLLQEILEVAGWLLRPHRHVPVEK
jgi:hypothetical protein